MALESVMPGLDPEKRGSDLHSAKTKAEIRKQALARRDSLSVDRRMTNSLLAAELGADDILFEPGTIISAFLPIRSEIDPRPLIDNLSRRGATICLPAVIDKTTIVFRRFASAAQLVRGSFGLMEPDPETMTLNPQIILMPLSAFDDKGNRLGYGAGYYDRAITKLIDGKIFPQLIGLAFDCQQCSHIPQESHDIAMHAIITESGYRKFNAN